MVICAVYNCNSNNDKRLKRNAISSNHDNIRFFRFPQNVYYSKIWIQKCSRRDKFNTKTSYICSKHFTSDNYIRNLQHELLNYSPKSSKKLKADAIPSMNLPSSRAVLESSLKRQERQKRRELKLIVANVLASNISTENCDTNIVDHENECPENSITLKVDKATNTCDLNEKLINESNISTLLSSNNTLLSSNNTLLIENKRLMTECYKLTEEHKYMEKIFTANQRRKMQTRGKRIRWEVDDISQAIAIHASGPKAYRLLLKKKYPFPAVSTLKRWASKIDINPGYLNVVFKLMENVEFSARQKVCILMADEMKIQKSYEYDQKSDILLAPSNYVQLIMARGLFENWKQPVYYNYDEKLSKTVLETIILKLYKIKYDVVAIVTDLGGGNRGLWNQYGISEKQPYFLNPCDVRKKIYVFCDTPHMIKLLRNHFLDSGILLNNNLMTKEPLQELLENQSKSDLKVASRLTPTHLAVKGGQRQKVKFATQLFSHTNSSALLRMGSLGITKSKHWLELANLLQQVNDWFDIFNSRVPKIDSRPRMAAYGLAMPEHEAILNDMENLIKEMRIGSNKTLLPFQKGIITNIHALKMLFVDLKKEYKISYILTYRLNQDPLEMFFGVMRAKGGLYDHPNALQFKYRLRSHLLGRNECIISQSANIECDNSNFIKMNINTCLSHSSVDESELFDSDETRECSANLLTSNLLSEITQDECTQLQDSTQHMTDLEYDGLEYLAGYIIKRLQIKIPLIIDSHAEIGSSYNFTWTDQVSEGGLKKPNRQFIQTLKKLEDIFNEVNSTSLKTGRNYMKTLLLIAEEINLDLEIKKLYFRCRMFFKMRILNAQLLETVNSRKRKLNKTIN